MQIKRELADNVFPSVCKKVPCKSLQTPPRYPWASQRTRTGLAVGYLHAQVPVWRGWWAFKVPSSAIKHWSSPGVLGTDELSLLLISREGNLRLWQRICPSPGTFWVKWSTTHVPMDSQMYALANRPPSTNSFHHAALCKGQALRGFRPF